VKRALVNAGATRTARIGVREFLAAVLASRRPDPAAELLFALGVDVSAARERLASQG
jgi:hypothetical protein